MLIKEFGVSDFKDLYAAANRIRAATESLTSSSDVALVNDYLQELYKIAREQEEGTAQEPAGANIMPLRRIGFKGSLVEALPSDGKPRILTLRIVPPEESA